ncbi:hypothetical protein CR513_07447, partial [Mucuna pruriens]
MYTEVKVCYNNPQNIKELNETLLVVVAKCSFVSGRYKLDNIIIVQEIFSTMRCDTLLPRILKLK